MNSGSTGRIAENIGQVLIENGHESFIAYGRGNQNSQSQLIKIGSRFDMYLHVLITRLFDRHGFGSKQATKKLIKKIDKIKPDAVGLHNVHGYYLNIEVLFTYLLEKEIPVIWTFHDCWPFTGHCTLFDYIQCEKWKTHCQKCPKTKKYPSSFGWDNSFKNFSQKKRLFSNIENIQIITPSLWLKNLVIKSFLKKSTTCIRNGVDLNKFRPNLNTNELKDKLKLGNRIVVLGVGNIWDDRKGLSDFMKLAVSLPTNFQIILIGLQKRQLKDLPKNIIGVVRTENIEELATYYNLATVLVNPTYEDNFPTINIEALACGTPVITYSTGGSPEAIDEETGEVVSKGDKKELQEAIIKWCTTKNEGEVQKKCRERALQFFNKDDCYAEYLQLYEKISKNDKFLDRTREPI